MKTSERFAGPSMLFIASAAALSLTVAVGQAAPAFAGKSDHIVVPPVPSNLQVPPGNRVYLAGHAEGTQDYICMPCPNAITPAAMCPASGFAWAFYGPQATLFDMQDANTKRRIQ